MCHFQLQRVSYECSKEEWVIMNSSVPDMALEQKLNGCVTHVCEDEFWSTEIEINSKNIGKGRC